MLDFILLRIAKSSILSHFDSSKSVDMESLIQDYPFLNLYGASFVTLYYDENLRGCVGSIIAHRTLFDDIKSNAYSSAFRDTRFNPIEENEFEHLSLEISVLSKPKLLEYSNFDDLIEKIRPNFDGLILKYGSFQGTFLPQVWEQLSDAKSFLEQLSIKAGANPTIYANHPDIYTYQVDSIKEKFDEILSL